MKKERSLHAPRDLLLSDVQGGPAPIILDPRDGLPRPADEGIVVDAVPSATDENFVCQEGGPWLSWDEATAATSPAPADLDPDALVFTHVSARGQLATVAGYGLAEERIFTHQATGLFYKRARPACVHYMEIESPATELSKVQDAQGIMRQCLLNDMALTDVVLRGCIKRQPRDIVSEDRLVRRARRKDAERKLAPTKLFRDPNAAEIAAQAVGFADPLLATSTGFLEKMQGPNGETVSGMLLGCTPADKPTSVVRSSPLHVVFPDVDWQPRDDSYYGISYNDTSGQKSVWSASMSGETISRLYLEPSDDPMAFVGARKWGFQAHVDAIAAALVAGRNIVMVPYHAATQALVIDAVRSAIPGALAAANKKKGKS